MENKTFHIFKNDAAIIYLKSRDKRLAKVIDKIGELDCNIHEDGYEFIVGEIVGQMLSNKVSDRLMERLVELCDGEISLRTISELSVQELRQIGISNAKAQYILNFNNAIKNGSLNLSDLSIRSDKEIMNALTSIKGIGPWTAKMYLLFVLNRKDILPYEDGAFLQSYKWLYETEDASPISVKKQCECWTPYSSIGARYLYRILDTGLTKTSISEILNND